MRQVHYKLFVDDITTMSLYSDTSMFTGTQLYNAFRELFKLPLQEFTINLEDVAVPTLRCWITWNNELFRDVPVLDITGKCSFSDYCWILENIKTKHQLNFGVEPTEYPNNPGTVKIPDFGAATIEIDHGRWINIKQLDSIKADKISIWRVSLTDPQINAFLRKWRDSEEESNWRQLKIYFNREANSEVVLQGLDITDEDFMRAEDDLNQWSFNTNNGKKCTVTYAHYVRDELEFGFDFHVGI